MRSVAHCLYAALLISAATNAQEWNPNSDSFASSIDGEDETSNSAVASTSYNLLAGGERQQGLAELIDEILNPRPTGYRYIQKPPREFGGIEPLRCAFDLNRLEILLEHKIHAADPSFRVMPEIVYLKRKIFSDLKHCAKNGERGDLQLIRTAILAGMFSGKIPGYTVEVETQYKCLEALRSQQANCRKTEKLVCDMADPHGEPFGASGVKKLIVESQKIRAGFEWCEPLAQFTRNPEYLRTHMHSLIPEGYLTNNGWSEQFFHELHLRQLGDRAFPIQSTPQVPPVVHYGPPYPQYPVRAFGPDYGPSGLRRDVLAHGRLIERFPHPPSVVNGNEGYFAQGSVVHPYPYPHLRPIEPFEYEVTPVPRANIQVVDIELGQLRKDGLAAAELQLASAPTLLPRIPTIELPLPAPPPPLIPESSAFSAPSQQITSGVNEPIRARFFRSRRRLL